MGSAATLTYKQLVFGVSYVDTDGEFTLTNGKNAARSGVVVSLGVFRSDGLQPGEHSLPRLLADASAGRYRRGRFLPM